jgi:hypothetical protein
MSLIAMTNPGVPGYIAFAESMQQFTAIWSPLGWVLSSAGVPGIPDRGKWQAPSFSTSLTIDATQGDLVFVTLNGNVTAGAIVNSAEGQEMTVVVKQDATGGRTWTWAAGINVHGWPTLSTGAGNEDTIQLVYRASNSTWYTVEATVTGGTVDTTPPDAPTGVIATGSDSAVRVQWNGVDGAANYDVYQTTDNTVLGTAVATRVTVTSFTSTSLTNGTTYYFRVKARDAAGNVSGQSAQASATPPTLDTTPPSAPVGVTATPGITQVTVAWTAVSDAVNYDVFQSTTTGTLGSVVASGVVATSVTINGLSANTTYWFSVKARDVAGNLSAASTQAQVTVSTTANASKRLFVDTVNHQMVIGSRSGSRVKLLGNTVWGHNDKITVTGNIGDDAYANRELIATTLASMGTNLVRFRLLAESYMSSGTTSGDGTYYNSQARSIQVVKDWRDTITAHGMYFMPCWWDSIDATAAGGSGLTAHYADAFPMMTAVRNALGDDPMVVYEPWNEPNNVGLTNWKTVVKATIDLFRTTLGYQGPLFFDGDAWSHRYDDAAMGVIDAYDATKTADGLHNIIHCKHDYGNETGYGGSDTPTVSTWANNDGSGSPWDFASNHLVFESEFGRHNGSSDGTHTTWATNLANLMAARFPAQNTFVGYCGFLFQWVDSNTETTLGDYVTLNAWGAALKAANATAIASGGTGTTGGTGGTAGSGSGSGTGGTGGGGTTFKRGWELTLADVGVPAGVSLTTVTGAQTYTSSSNGQTITAKKFTGLVTMNSTVNGLTFVNCEFDVGVDIQQGSHGVTMQFCTVHANAYSAIFLSGDGITLYRVELDGVCDNWFTVGANTGPIMIDECWAIAPMSTYSGDPHYDVLELYAGQDITVRRSNLQLNVADHQASVINIAPYFTGVDMRRIKIYENFLDMGNSLVLVDTQNSIPIRDIQVMRNHMGGHQNTFVGRYTPLNNEDGVSLVETIPAANSTSVYWPTTNLAEANYWDRSSDLSPDKTGLVVVP